MATVLSTLYPPLIDTFMPAFPKAGPAVVNFSLSPYNSSTGIKKIHVSLVNQLTNKNAFKSSFDASISNTVLINGIWIISFENISSIFSIDESNNTCQLSIPASLLKSDSYIIGNYYKVQIRFDAESATQIENITSSDYFINNRGYFSEWSSVCLIKAIPDISIYMNGFDDSYRTPGEDVVRDEPSLQAGIIPFSGNVVFDDGDKLSTQDQETLQSFEISIVNTSTEETVAESGKIYTNTNIDPNKIYWLADLTNAEADEEFDVYLTATTKNQYTFSETYAFSILSYDSTSFTPTFTYKKMNLERYGATDIDYVLTAEDGIIQFNITTEESMPPGYLYVKRASSRDDFKTWELVSCTKESGAVDRDFIDPTVGSLVRYKYSCQYRLRRGPWTATKYSKEILYPDFYDILLYRDGRQLAIRYNEQITSYTSVVNRQKINTLGGKYPKFAENAQMNYKQFSISGLLIAEADYNRKFLNDLDYEEEMDIYDEVMGGAYSVRNDTFADNTYTYTSQINDPEQDSHVYKGQLQKNTLHDLYPMDNWWWERLFREEALKWLNDGNPKLFRSMTEGNYIVMLTDISLTPNAQLGRRVYNFSATAHEVGDGYSLEELSALGIIDIPDDYTAYMNEHQGTEDSEDDEESGYITVSTVGQLYSKTGTDKTLVYYDNSGNKPQISEYTIDDLYNGLLYQGALGNYSVVEDSYILQDLKIQFESDPQWHALDSSLSVVDLELYNSYLEAKAQSKSVIDYPDYLKNETPLSLGYRLKIYFTTNSSALIFVNEKGYYQIPSNLEVKDIVLFDGDVATLDYKISYKIQYNESSIPTTTELSEHVAGQVNGMWNPGDSVRDEIASKYYYIQRSNNTTEGNKGILSIQELAAWTALGLDVTPYAVANIRFEDETTGSDHVVGRTGVYNLMTDFPTEEIIFQGRRMVRVDSDRIPYLDEWEFVIDNSALIDKSSLDVDINWYEGTEKTDTPVIIDNGDATYQTNANEEGINRYINDYGKTTRYPDLEGYAAISDIKNPQYNTVYGVIENNTLKYKIYYLDEGWYDVEFADDSQEIILAKVPIHGMVNYLGDLIRQEYT